MQPSSRPIAVTSYASRASFTTLLLLFLLSTTACAPRATTPTRVVVVEKGQVTPLADGAYRVTQGWMVHRMKVETGLKAALDRCSSELAAERAR